MQRDALILRAASDRRRMRGASALWSMILVGSSAAFVGVAGVTAFVASRGGYIDRAPVARTGLSRSAPDRTSSAEPAEAPAPPTAVPIATTAAAAPPPAPTATSNMAVDEPAATAAAGLEEEEEEPAAVAPATSGYPAPAKPPAKKPVSKKKKKR